MVGDPHAKIADLQEMSILMDFIEETAVKYEVKEIIFLGDLTDTHDIIRLRVLAFWKKSIKKLARNFLITILGGNHDAVGDNDTEWVLSSMMFLEDIPNVKVITEGARSHLGFDYIPYTHSEERFKKAVESLKSTGNKTLVSHQAYDGGQYDNGMYIPDGFKTDTVAHYEHVYNGHIHTESDFANIHCVGSPRWMGLSDANQDKGIFLIKNGERTKISNNATSKVVSKILDENSEQPILDLKDKNYITLVGSSKWIASAAKHYKGVARVIPKPTDSMTINKKQSYSSFKDFLLNQKIDVKIEEIILEVENA